MQRFKHAFMINKCQRELQGLLEAFGKEGWELVSVIRTNGLYDLFFKKEKIVYLSDELNRE